MKLYFSGFCLENEENLFESYREKSDFCVSGFSYGAIKALEYVLAAEKRVDKLQLFSPAFFVYKDEKYTRTQLFYFQKNAILYADTFLKNAGLVAGKDSPYYRLGNTEELEKLLYYQWDKEKMEQLIQKKIVIEVFLGSDDKIVDAAKALQFFKQFAEVYYIKNKGHIL